MTLLVGLLNRGSEIAARIAIALFFIGFLEEFLFRGYMQSTLNQVFGKLFEWLQFRFGWGLVITALPVGLIHVISPGNPWHWASGFWTFISGIGFGIIREKGGGFLAPALVHGFSMIFSIIFA